MFSMMRPGPHNQNRPNRGRRGSRGPFPHRHEERRGGAGFPADVIEKDDRYEIRAELAGVKKDDIKVELEEKTIFITATKRQTCDPEENNYLCQERVIGKFQRQFPLENIKEEEIRAEYKDGILTLRIPKLKDYSEKRQKIDIE